MDGAPGWWDVVVFSVAEVSLVKFAVSQFSGRCSKGTICECGLILVLVGIAFQPGNGTYVQVALKYPNPLAF